MSSYYDDPDFADEYRRRDEEALTAHIEDRERDAERRRQEALGAAPGYCRELNPQRTHMCDLPAGHDGDHSGFELPTVTLDDLA